MSTMPHGGMHGQHHEDTHTELGLDAHTDDRLGGESHTHDHGAGGSDGHPGHGAGHDVNRPGLLGGS